ncbi:hypothetical protein F3Y22_tig00110557pilonHSYRG00353 [Hibiscus syriacus]|uniref:Uncharacterized protein n=1 Tax=Hibiscus syriacus TaxID=106335 RepID=A0A6A3ABV7_HIBSY|nr:hypothetical protein F3Y22_tig00110557pilonHSYRG00353 [Hibiscus syriacus]
MASQSHNYLMLNFLLLLRKNAERCRNSDIIGVSSNPISLASALMLPFKASSKEFHLGAYPRASEVAIGKTINDDVIPVVEKFQKKKERTLNRKKRQEMLLSSFRSSCAGMTRTCRNHRPISYTFDEYDRAIDEAIEITKRRKTIEEQSQGQKLPRQTFGSNGGSYVEGTVSKDSSDGKANSMGSETEDDKLQKAGDNGNEKEDNDDDYSSETDGDVNNSSNLGSSADENENLNNHKKHVDGITVELRQRPVVNSALETIVPDSEDDTSSEIQSDMQIAESFCSSNCFCRNLENFKSGWPSGLRRQTQVLVFGRGRGFKSHF